MKRFTPIQVIIVVMMAVMIGGVVGCGSDTNSCSCEICVNDEPAYPCDSEASCADFASARGCSSYTYTNSTTDTCGDDAQPVCRVHDCSSSCNGCQ